MDVSGLLELASRPALPQYLFDLWVRRDFTLALAAARLRAEHAQDTLGTAWQLLNPLLLAGVYFVVFGVILGTDRGIENFIAYLVIGILVFDVGSRSAQSGATSLVNNRNLLQTLHFPRAVLPVASTLVATAALLPALVVIGGVALLTGEPLRLTWLLALPALVLQLGFNIGLALVLARLTARVQDVRRGLPFLLRAWLYFSGVFYGLDRVVDDSPLLHVLEANPAYVFITLVRAAFMPSVQVSAGTWTIGAIWAVGMMILGLLVFWHGEGGRSPGSEYS
jgi:teichoic acid transport system permease protein